MQRAARAALALGAAPVLMPARECVDQYKVDLVLDAHPCATADGGRRRASH
jgi:hypothetical protein